jgi:hypothetical protein
LQTRINILEKVENLALVSKFKFLKMAFANKHNIFFRERLLFFNLNQAAGECLKPRALWSRKRQVRGCDGGASEPDCGKSSQGNRVKIKRVFVD